MKGRERWEVKGRRRRISEMRKKGKGSGRIEERKKGEGDKGKR